MKEHLHSFYIYGNSIFDKEKEEKRNAIRPIFFFDLDNTLYSKSSGIGELMGERITQFFQNYLKLPLEDSEYLGRKYYLDYGLAIRGLIKDFNINPLDYDSYVDGGLPLEDILEPQDYKNEALKSLLGQLTECRKWIFTNAGLKHAKRVLKILELEEFFEGIIYCDYCEPNFPAKPQSSAFERAMFITKIDDPGLCYFIDDSPDNVRGATEFGWNAVLIDEENDINTNSRRVNLKIVKSIEEIKWIFPELMQKSHANNERTDKRDSEMKMDCLNVPSCIVRYDG